MSDNPKLTFDFDPHQYRYGCVRVHNLRPDLVSALHLHEEAGSMVPPILRVRVVEPELQRGDELPDVAGRCQILESGLRFIPSFPFEPGIFYRVKFDPRPLGGHELADELTLEFALPKKKRELLPTAVTHIFPSDDVLPENLLRFYVSFSNPMQRGWVEANMSLVGPDGEPAHDVLYRAPVELWDRSMQHLTVLLDPGRLKRGVGPNRALGPPLKPGLIYTLAVGAGISDISGDKLPETVHKRFHVTDAVRDPVAVEQWKSVLPETDSRQPLMLLFPKPLDWGMLSHTITISSACGHSIAGQVVIDQCERRWSFTPTSPWAAGSYQVCVDPSLEDICGNSVLAAFDRPIRPDADLAYEMGISSISFRIGEADHAGRN